MSELTRHAVRQVARRANPTLASLGQQLEENHCIRLTFNTWKEGSEEERVYFRHWELLGNVNAIPGRSLDDLRIKARAAQMALHFDECVEFEGPGSFRDLATSLIDDLLTMTGEAS